MKRNNEMKSRNDLVFWAMLPIMMVLIALPTAAFPASVMLDWDPSTDADLAGYRVYYQANSSTLPFEGTGAVEGSAPVDVANTLTATVGGLDPANSYFFAVTAYNSAGLESAYSNVIEIPESLSPTITISSPANNSSVQGTVTVSAAASDNKGITSVEFYRNGVLEVTDSAAPYGYSWDTSSLTSGNYTLMAKAYDAAGNEGQSEVVVTVAGDITPPTVSLAAPAYNTAVSGSVTITASATDNIGTTKIEVYDNGALTFASNENPVSYIWNSLLDASGTHVLTAKAYDAAGNVGLSGKVTLNASDVTAPVVSIASPVANSTVGGSVAISANAGDNVAVTKVEFFVNGALKATSTSAPYGFNWNTAALANRAYTLSAKAYDAAGNIGQAASVAVNVFNEKVAPTVSIVSPVVDSTVSGILAVSVNASDNVGVTKVVFLVNGVTKATSTSAPYGFNWKTAALANGAYTLSAKAFDAAGNIGKAASVAVNVFNEKVAPTVSIASPVVDSTVKGMVAVSVNASDNVGVTKVVFLVNGVAKATSTSAPYGFNWQTAALANGAYILSVKAFDAAGNIGQAAPVAVNVFNDKIAPTVSIAFPIADSTLSGIVAVSADASDNVGVTKVVFLVNGVAKATSTSVPYSFNWKTAALASGAYTLSAKAYDAAGKVGLSSLVTVTVLNP